MCWTSYEPTVIKLPAASRVFLLSIKVACRNKYSKCNHRRYIHTYFSVCWSIREFVLWSGSSEPVQEGTRHSGRLDWVGLGCECVTCLWILPHFGSAVIDLDFVAALQTPTVGVNLQTFCNLLSNFQLHQFWKLRTQRWEVPERIGLS